MIIAASLMVLAWIATYAVHSVLWLVPAIWFARHRAVVPRARALVLLICVVAPLVTATFSQSTQLGRPLALPGLHIEEDRRVNRTVDVLGNVNTTESGGLTRASRVVLVGVAGLAGAFLLVAVVRSAAMMRARRLIVRNFGDRLPVTSPAWLAAFREVAQQLRLHNSPCFTFAESLGSPVALNSEVCIPASWNDRRDLDEMRVVLAHELEHVVWRDPQILAALQFLRRALPWQPLLSLALVSYLEAAEEACDAAAIRSTGDARSVAHVLLRLAPVQPATVAFTSLNSGRGIRQRIERIVAAPATMRRGPVAGAALIFALLIVSVFLPHVAKPETREAPDVEVQVHVTSEHR